MTATAPQQPGDKAIVSRIGDRELHIERMFNASRARVWDANTKPELLAQWWGRGNKLTVEKFEAVRGGHWRFVEHTDQGDHGFEGRFREVKEPELLSMTFEWDGQPGHVIVQTINFIALSDSQTKIVCTSSFFEKEDLDGMVSSGMEGGMNESYDALDRLLASTN